MLLLLPLLMVNNAMLGIYDRYTAFKGWLVLEFLRSWRGKKPLNKGKKPLQNPWRGLHVASALRLGLINK